LSSQAVGRRSFLASLGCAGLGSSTLFSSLVHLGAASSASAQSLPPGDDYRALVCILLAGGIDSYNLLVPTESSEYAQYRSVRADLALEPQQLLPLPAPNLAGRSFGLHPAAPELQALYNQGDLAFLANAGTLVEPVTLSSIDAGTARLPVGLYSHSDQIAQWQTALPADRSSHGWGGRIADLLADVNRDQRVSMSISLDGSNLFQAGLNSSAHSVETDPNAGPGGLFGYGNPDLALRSAAVDSLLNQDYKNLFEQAYARRMRNAIDADLFFRESLEGVSVATPFPPTRLGRGLQMVARTISARERLGVRRQTFFLIYGGWDHHDEVIANQERMLPVVSQAVGAFQQSLDEIGMTDQVVTFSISDFGRTLTSNGRGSDHGWGGNQFVVGGPVRGGRIFGQYPSLFAGAPLDTGRGRLIPTTSVDEYFAELGLWFGVDRSQLDLVLPNIARFYSPSSADPPVGFLL